ncbi:SDR family NAD(P)-dependent oxidoreductase [Advenella mimigardefordensis]|uniref:Gluconate 5-dehydrogenase n=1 Tax=Advenella mimigardefordensis (strain DSM 17166 / LMG 22922 / DPN7) TaxID=1247726 RepID=W0PDD5_ADVMD|nr:SDR family oxidoreductase [Advenella mimigardefordensis]AHG63053.1 gluconate 5-dehydrogenase [Advenella mimigardefordensis DPN7]
MKNRELFGLSGRTALVTGGNSGIGAAIARGLGLAGAQVVLVARREQPLIDQVALLTEEGIAARYCICDLADHSALQACADEAMVSVGDIDILVNAAGVNLRQPFEQVDYDSWRQQMELHLAAPFFLTQALAPAMKKKGWGRIINIASLQSYRAFADSAPYGAAKGGVVQLTRAIAQEWSPYGITCNAIGPGFFPTPLTASVFGQADLSQRHAAQTCIGRNGQLDDLHGVAVFLASQASSYITGQVIMVDGGYTAK